MFDFETTLSGIEYKIRKLVDENNGLRAEIARLTESNEELRETIKNQEETINKQKEETNILKLRNTLVQKGDSAEIKLKINQLIRNIDKSLSLLTQIND
jgi:prefoldin subunit 5